VSQGRWEVRQFEELGSTNDYLCEEARRGAPEGVVAVADHQSAGRGRLDRRWESPPGASLLASVLFRPTFDRSDLHLCTGVVALAAIDACEQVAGVRASLKWPNDLLVGEAKLGGVLAETEFFGDECAVVVGIGINVAWPGPTGVGGTCLDRESGEAVDRDALLTALLAALAPRRALLDTPSGRRAVAAEMRALCSTVGHRVHVELSGGVFEGEAVEIDDAGHLVVQTEDGPRTVTAGDVVHVRRH